jgi:hypothetical protein
MRIICLLASALFLMAPAWAVVIGPQPPSSVVRFKGVITAIDILKKHIILNGKTTIRVTPKTEITMKGQEIRFEHLVSGTGVWIEGRMVENAPVAHTISILYLGR